MKRLFIFSVFFFFLTVLGFTQADLQPVATVNLIRTEPILVRQLRTEIERFTWAMLAQQLERPPSAEEINRATASFSEEQRRQVLETVIDQRLVLQAAERDRVIVTDNELNQRIQQLRSMLAQQLGRPPTEEEFAQAVRNDSGLEVPAFREQMQRQMVMDKYIMSQKQSLFENARAPTEAEINNVYNLSRSQFVRPETVRYSMIRVPYGSDAASRTRARELAERLLREIGNSSARFNETQARATAPNSGYVRDDGYLPRNMEAAQIVGQEFMTTAFELRPGQISRVMEGRQGFQIIMITEHHAFSNLELNDVLMFGTNITVRDYIGQQLLMRQQQDIILRATQEVITELRAAGSFQIIERNLRW